MQPPGPPEAGGGVHCFIFRFRSKPSGLRCPVFAAGDGAPLQKADRVPLALSQFSQRATERPCENWSAAPAATPCIIHWMRSPPLPLLRLACICRRQRLGSAASRPLAVSPCRCATSPSGGLNFQLLLHPEGKVIGFRVPFSSIGIVSPKGPTQCKPREEQSVV